MNYLRINDVHGGYGGGAGRFLIVPPPDAQDDFKAQRAHEIAEVAIDLSILTGFPLPSTGKTLWSFLRWVRFSRTRH